MKIVKSPKLLHASLSVSLLIIALSVAYYVAVFLPHKEILRREQNQEILDFEKELSKKEDQKKQDLKECMYEAVIKREEAWDEGLFDALRSTGDLKEIVDNFRDRYIEDCMLVRGYTDY